ncbi:hypothetical protein QTH90_29830 [Variovorax sp. J2P1-59]|uniref:hypothetical protein n=1 Tax=Variovorax flavidus TaxID=3053501 RepID=UPI00257761E4|nr:hypothetical protein [Variovorax sp. J2P1-59]MDM0078640.1 hypothetical protein [Variovorax sp. J2P1-59]
MDRILGSRTIEGMILTWVLLAVAVVFAFLAYDAARLSSPETDVPFALTAKGWGEDVAHVSLAEQEKRKQYSRLRGIGDLNQSVWLFVILCIGCLAGAGYSLVP